MRQGPVAVVIGLLFSFVAHGQKHPPAGAAIAKGSCNQVSSGNNNSFVINCSVGAVQGEKLIKLLNKILKNQVDLTEVSDKVNEMVEQNSALLSYGSPTSGELIPGHDPDPPVHCRQPLPQGGYKIFMGNSVIYKSELPVRALVTTTGDYVELQPMGNGIAVSALVKSMDGRVITKIEEGHFVANANNTLVRSVSDDHTSLQVIDEYNRLALSVRFLNPTSIQVKGNFSTSGGYVTIGDDSTLVAGAIFGGICSVNDIVAMRF